MFPFYNADNGNATNMHIVNTTAPSQSTQSPFRMEYKNSDEVLDFNLYLSPKDHFAFGVIKLTPMATWCCGNYGRTTAVQSLHWVLLTAPFERNDC